MGRKKNGTLFIIGGHEDKSGARLILEEFTKRLRKSKLVVTTVASEVPAEVFASYRRVFHALGVAHVVELRIEDREQARQQKTVSALDDAGAIFITGGDQLRITSQIGDTPVFRRLHELFEQGAVIGGTSAGASVVCETMLVSGNGQESPHVGDLVQMAPGLGLVTGIIVDQHFAERGRMGRLLGAVAENPRMLGVGIDEDTAIIVEGDKGFQVIGSGAVYVVDGSTVTDSNMAEASAEQVLSVYDVKLHVLAQGDCFDLEERRPGKIPRREARRLQEQAARDGSGD